MRWKGLFFLFVFLFSQVAFFASGAMETIPSNPDQSFNLVHSPGKGYAQPQYLLPELIEEDEETDWVRRIFSDLLPVSILFWFSSDYPDLPARPDANGAFLHGDGPLYLFNRILRI